MRDALSAGPFLQFPQAAHVIPVVVRNDDALDLKWLNANLRERGDDLVCFPRHPSVNQRVFGRADKIDARLPRALDAVDAAFVADLVDHVRFMIFDL